MSKTGTFISVALDQEGKQPRIVTPNHRLHVDNIGTDISRGKVPGASTFGSYGERSALAGESNRVVWPNGTFTLPPAAGVQMSLVSSSANDTAAGSGINSVEIHYLDADLNEKTEIVELSGLTPVTTTATDIRFIQCLHAQTWGNDFFADGTITASNAGTIYSQINAGDSRCTSSMRMVPGGKVAYVTGASASAASGTSAAKVVIRLVSSQLDLHEYIDPLGLFGQGTVVCQDGSESLSFPSPFGPFSEGNVIGFTLTTDKDAFVGASWFGFIEDA